MRYRATFKWGAFAGRDPLDTRTSIKFEAPCAKEAERIAKSTAEINPDWLLENVELDNQDC